MEGHYLQLHPLLHLLPHLQHRLQGDQIGVGNIHVSPHELDAVGNLPFQCLDGALFHILMGQQRLALGPTLDPLEQGAGEVPARFTGRLGGIKMDVRLDKGGDGETLLTIKLMGCEQRGAHGLDGPDHASLTEDLPHPFPARQTHIPNQHVLSPSKA